MDDVGAAPKTEGKGYLETRFSISGPEAIDRLHRQDDAELFSLQLAQRYPGAFLGMEIQHSPTYRIVLSMGSNEFDPAIRQEIPPSLKPYVQIRRSRMSKPEAEAYRIALITALSGQRISLAFDYTRDRFIVTAPEAKRAEINKLIPADLKALVDLQFGQTPSAFQTNATSADTLTAGWLHYGISGPSYYCTFAFTARDSQGRQSLLTAEHCQSSVSETRNNNQSAGNKVITFGQPLNSNYRRYEYNSGLSRSYDFRLIPAPIVSSGAWVWFSNPTTNTYQKAFHDASQPSGWRTDTISYTNQYSGLPSSGYVATIGSAGSGTTTGVYNPGHPNGAVRCKSGGTTGTTCGLVTQSTYYFINSDGVVMDGMVQVGQSSQPVIAAPGDSGGPIFSQPVWNSTYSRYDVKAAGIMHGGNLLPVNPVYTGPTDPKRPCDARFDSEPCTFAYLPIDRINDYEPSNIKIFSGATEVYVAP